MHRQSVLTCNSDPLHDIIQLKAKDTVFLAHKRILTSHSEYFRRCLNGPFLESGTKTIEFEDVEPGDLGFYLNVCYMHDLRQPQGYDCKQACSFKLEVGTDFAGYPDLIDWVRIYRLSDRFLNTGMVWHAETSFNGILDYWMVRLPRTPDSEDLHEWVVPMGRFYAELIKDGPLKFEAFANEVVSSFAHHCPLEMWEHFSTNVQRREDSGSPFDASVLPFVERLSTILQDRAEATKRRTAEERSNAMETLNKRLCET